MSTPRPFSDQVRFWLSVEPSATEQDCWIWRDNISHLGYGYFYMAGEKMVAHRVAYEVEVGPIPAGFELDHLCRNRACVNPAHLEPVTHRENTLRGDTVPARNAAVTHCPQGHEYTPENTRIYRGGRYCRTCRKAAALAYYYRQRAKRATV